MEHGRGQTFYHVSRGAVLGYAAASDDFMHSHCRDRELQKAKVEAPKHGRAQTFYHAGDWEGGQNVLFALSAARGRPPSAVPCGWSRRGKKSALSTAGSDFARHGS